MRNFFLKFKKRAVFKDIFWYTLANASTQLSSLVGVLFVSRYLGPTNMGIYSFIQNYISFFVTFLASLDTYANWMIIKSDSIYSELHRYTKIKALLTVPIIFIFLVTSFFVLPSDIFKYIAIMLIPVCTSIFSSYVFVLQHENRARLIAWGIIFSTFIILVAKLTAVFLNAPLSVFVFINSLDGLILTFLCVYVIVKSEQFFKDDYKVVTFLDIWLLIQASFYTIIYMFTWYLVVRVDQFFVPIYFNARELGLYSAAVKVIEMTNVLIVIMQAVILPRILQLQDPKNNLKKVHITLLAYLSAGICSAVSIYVLAPIVVKILFGQSFYETAHILRVYAWSIPGLFVTYLFTTIALSKNSYKQLAYVSLVFGFFSTVFVYYAARTGNILHVALVSVFIYSFSAIVFYTLWRKNIL